jgi:NAD(P)-dependent dehydrogenase (short-subunit alcohol dehydrogenase family)
MLRPAVDLCYSRLMGECEGRVALITGASRGIGRAIARRLAAEGAAVVLSASRRGLHGSLPGTLDEAVAEIRQAGGRAEAVAADLRDPEARADLVERSAACFGPIDILVNNAAGARMKMPSELSHRERTFLFEVNVNAPIDLAQQALPSMRERGCGWILNIGSATSGQPPVPYRDSRAAALVIGGYGASKAALERYSEALAHEVAPDGVFVNVLAPVAIVLTPGAEHVRDLARRFPDWVEPMEVMVEAALELCSGRHVARVVTSRPFLHSIARSVRSLDGAEILGDASLGAVLSEPS